MWLFNPLWLNPVQETGDDLSVAHQAAVEPFLRPAETPQRLVTQGQDTLLEDPVCHHALSEVGAECRHSFAAQVLLVTQAADCGGFSWDIDWVRVSEIAVLASTPPAYVSVAILHDLPWFMEDVDDCGHDRFFHTNRPKTPRSIIAVDPGSGTF